MEVFKEIYEGKTPAHIGIFEPGWSQVQPGIQIFAILAKPAILKYFFEHFETFSDCNGLLFSIVCKRLKRFMKKKPQHTST